MYEPLPIITQVQKPRSTWVKQTKLLRSEKSLVEQWETVEDAEPSDCVEKKGLIGEAV